MSKQWKRLALPHNQERTSLALFSSLRARPRTYACATYACTRGKAERPAYLAASSSSSSMRSSWLYLLTRSPRAGAPVLIWPAFTATDRSAIVTSSVSPERWEITVVYPLVCAREIASRVSETVPIWFSLTSSELAELSSMPLARRSGLVTNRSSPTIWTLSPTSPTSVDQPCQSSSSKGSSMEISG